MQPSSVTFGVQKGSRFKFLKRHQRIPGEELKTGRANAQYVDTKFFSQEGEWFIAGVLDGLPDSTSHPINVQNGPG